MFEYVSTHNITINQIFCIICTTVIADYNGYVANVDKTEVEEKYGPIANYYRDYYENIVGKHNKELEWTEVGLDENRYYKDYYDKIAQRFNITHGKDKFVELSQVEQFDIVFNESLLPTSIRQTNEKLLNDGCSEQYIKDISKEFRVSFRNQFRCKIDECTLLYSTENEAWRSLYVEAVRMPHTVIGLRKKLSNRESMFFRQNKDNLEILNVFVSDYFRDEVKTPYKSYQSGFRISGIIVDNFAKYLAGKFIREYAGIISSPASYYEGEDGELLSGSELQNKMYSTSASYNGIDDFENLLNMIEAGGVIYDINSKDYGVKRHFNLIAWRQNELKKEVVESLSKSRLARKLKELNLGIGGYLDNNDIANKYHSTPDKKIRIDKIDAIVRDGFNTHINSEIGRRKIDEWMKVEMDAYNEVGGVIADSEVLKSGRSVLDFKRKDETSDGKRTNNRTMYNYTMLRNLLRGIQAVHVLESEINSIDYHFLAFPIKGQQYDEYKLITGLSFQDYLRFDTSNASQVDIICDIEGDCDLDKQSVIENVSRINGEILSVINNNGFEIDEISFDSLTDDSLALSLDTEYDDELLEYLRYNNIKINIRDNKNVDTIEDVVFNDIASSLADSMESNFISLQAFLRNISNQSTSNINMLIARIRYTSQIIENFAHYGNLTHSLDEDSEVLDVLYLYSLYKKNKQTLNETLLTVLSGREVLSEDFERLSDSLYCEQNIQYRLMKSKYFHGKFYVSINNKNEYRYCGAFSRKDKDGKIVLNNLGILLRALDRRLKSIDTGKDVLGYDTLKVICNNFISYINSKGLKISIDSNDRFFLPRAICFGVNVSMVLNTLRYALKGICEHLTDYKSLFVYSEKVGKLINNDTNSDDVINVKLIIKTLKSLYDVNSLSRTTDKYNMLKVYERLFLDFIEAVDINKIEGKKVSSVLYRDFVFMDSKQVYVDDMEDVDERLIQYSEVAKILNVIMKYKKLFSIKFGGVEYTLYDFIRVVEGILDFSERHRDDDYLVNRVSRSELDVDVQEDISRAIDRYLDNNTEYKDIDENDTWLGNLMDYFNQHAKNAIGSNIYNSIKLRYKDYNINRNKLLTLNNRVVHTRQYTSNKRYIIVVTRYGLFRYCDGVCSLVEEIDDLKWMLY